MLRASFQNNPCGNGTDSFLGSRGEVGTFGRYGPSLSSENSCADNPSGFPSVTSAREQGPAPGIFLCELEGGHPLLRTRCPAADRPPRKILKCFAPNRVFRS